jgi:hypothetical protein
MVLEKPSCDQQIQRASVWGVSGWSPSYPFAVLKKFYHEWREEEENKEEEEVNKPLLSNSGSATTCDV